MPRELATGVQGLSNRLVNRQYSTKALLIERVNAQLLVITGQATCKALYLPMVHPTADKYQTPFLLPAIEWEARLVTAVGRI